MSAPVTIINSWPQADAVNGGVIERRERARLAKQAAKAKRESLLAAAHDSPGQFITFVGTPVNEEEEPRAVAILAGSGAPTVIGGWVRLAKQERFQRVSLTIPEGYDPIELAIPVQFEAVRLVKGRKNLEEDIADLEWMAGRSPNPPGGETSGEPPHVQVYTANGEKQVPLVPLQFQEAPGRASEYFITKIDFDPNPLRDTGGARLRQKATVTVCEIVATPDQIAAARRVRDKQKNKFKVVYTTDAMNTIKKVAVAEKHPGAWKAILEANRKVTNSADKPLRRHTKILVPKTIFRQVAA